MTAESAAEPAVNPDAALRPQVVGELLSYLLDEDRNVLGAVRLIHPRQPLAQALAVALHGFENDGCVGQFEHAHFDAGSDGELEHSAIVNDVAASSKLPPLQLRAISRVLADPTRFEILRKVASQECAACSDLRSVFPITPATLSHHLKELESCGLVEIAKRGKFIDVVFQRTLWNAYLTELNRM